jgi:hypothetical protein
MLVVAMAVKKPAPVRWLRNSPKMATGCLMAAIDITAGPLAEADHRVQLRRALFASTVGTLT